MKIKRQWLFLTAALVYLSINSLEASTLGLPGGSTGYATWDTFSGISFSSDVPDASNTTYYTLTLDSALAGGSTPGSGERIYQAGAPYTPAPTQYPYNFTIHGTVNQEFTEFTLAIKYTSPTSGDPEDFFNVTLDGGAPATGMLLGTVTHDSNTFNIVTWTWTGLNYSPTGDNNFSISVTSAGNHVSVDAIQAVPEPSTYALIGLGLAALYFFRPQARNKQAS